MERLNKVLALSNIASRRKADQLILEKRVKVNGQIVTELGFKVKKSDEILVDDKMIAKANLVYFLMNKPSGYLATTSDDKKRRKVIDLLSPEDNTERLYPVGRLEYDTAGALIITNDGNLTKHLTNPNTLVLKEYLVRVKGIIIKDKIRQLRLGVSLDNNEVLKVLEVNIVELDKKNQSTLLRIVVDNVKNKQIAQIIKIMGYEVKSITRTKYASLDLQGIARGSYRRLKIHEIKSLFNT